MNTWRLLARLVPVTGKVRYRSTSCTTPSITTLPRRRHMLTRASPASRRRRSFQTSAPPPAASRRRRTCARGTTPRRSWSGCSISSRGWTSCVPLDGDRRSVHASSFTPSSSSESTQLWSVNVTLDSLQVRHRKNDRRRINRWVKNCY